MAYPVGWGRKCSLAIQSSQVDSNLSNFPVLLNEDTLPSEMFDADGSYPALNGGGDIRFSSDSAGATQLACEVVSFVTDNDPANGSAEIWVKVPSVSSSANTTIYIWYNKAGESQPIADSTYGSQNVWDSDSKAIYHLQEDVNTDADGYKDSTSNNNHLTGVSMAITAPTAKIGIGAEVDGSADYLHKSSSFSTLTGNFSLSIWLKPDVYGTKEEFLLSLGYNNSNSLLLFYYLNAELYAINTVISTGGSAVEHRTDDELTNNVFNYIVIVRDGTDLYTYLNGSLVHTHTSVSTVTLDSGIMTIGWARPRDKAATYFNGVIDETRISNTNRSTDWISAEYSNQNSPSGFVVEGTPESTSLTFTGDANLKSIESTTFTGDTNLKTTVSATFTGNANLKSVESIVFTGDASLKSIESVIFTGDSFLKTRVTAIYAGDANLKIILSATFTGNANLKREYDFIGDANLKSIKSATFTGNTNLKITEAVTFTGDAALGNGTTGSFTGDTSLKLTESAIFTGDSFIQTRVTATFTGNANLKSVESTTFTGNASLKSVESTTFTGDANLKSETVATYTGDTNLKKTLSFIFTGDASLNSIKSATFTGDANLDKEITATFTGDAVLKTVVALIFTSDSNLLRLYTFTSDASLQKINITNFAGIITLDNKQQSYGFGFSGGTEFPLK